MATLDSVQETTRPVLVIEGSEHLSAGAAVAIPLIVFAVCAVLLTVGYKIFGQPLK